MAKAKFEIPMSNIASHLTMKVTAKFVGSRVWRLRVKVGIILIKLASRFVGTNVKLELERK